MKKKMTNLQSDAAAVAVLGGVLLLSLAIIDGPLKIAIAVPLLIVMGIFLVPVLRDIKKGSNK